VTLANRSAFAERVATWLVDTSVQEQFEPFRQGFLRVCDSPVLSRLSAAELEAIVRGGRDLDFEHLRRGARYVGYLANEAYMDLLWSVLLGFDEAQKRQFLHFATGSTLAPLAGLQHLRLTIQRNGGEPCDSLPTSHTCFNSLLLPCYGSREKLERSLLTAIRNAEGFGLV